MIGTIIKPAIKKTDYVKRNIFELWRKLHDWPTQIPTRWLLSHQTNTWGWRDYQPRNIQSYWSSWYDNCFLWASIPCTGGSPWQNTNSKKLGGPERIKEHKRLFNKVRASFKIVATECHKHWGRIAIEWPKGCEYGRTKHVEQYIQGLKLNEVHINGCAFGLIDNKGILILKHWTIATDDPYLHAKFQDNCVLEKIFILLTPQQRENIPNWQKTTLTQWSGWFTKGLKAVFFTETKVTWGS